ncbi:MAG: rRNA pseudouridine synthase [Oscillospiraceae bacterium]|nr:rRNA pseudouridine synthase [Oscillospiraceae bacterium]
MMPDFDAVLLQKAFSTYRIMSRRAAEKAIRGGRVAVNKKPAAVGVHVCIKRDLVELDGQPVEFDTPKKLYIMLNKPRGYVSSLHDEHCKRFAVDLLSDIRERVYNVGRLDKNSEGLLLFTNDGDFANKIMHPRNKIVKTYKVTIKPRVREAHLIKLSSQFILDGKEVSQAQVMVEREYTDRSVLIIKITQGKNRQIRRMCDLTGLEVVRLKRIALGDLKLGVLKLGQYRYLARSEVESFDFSLSSQLAVKGHSNHRFVK